MLLLFDIDGTLLRTDGAGRRALACAFRELFGVEDAMAGVRLDGATDPLILQRAFGLHLRRSPSEQEASQVIEAYLLHLERELIAVGDRYTVLPGALELPRAAAASGRCSVGLATGNVERGARLKLAPGGLNDYFAFGGFGSDAGDRRELVRIGLERGQDHAQATLGRRFLPSEVFVLGDTEQDVIAARAIGAVAVGVLAGSGVQADLIAASPDLLVDSLLDPRLWRALGLTRAEPAP